MALTVIFGNAPVNYRMYATSNTPALPMGRYHAAVKAGNTKDFVLTVKPNHFTLWVKQITKGKFGQIGWKTVMVNK